MGKDLVAGGRITKHKRRMEPKTDNVYHRLLVKLYSFLARRTDSKFNKLVLKRLVTSRTNRPPMGLARLKRYMKGREGKIAVVVGTVTDDVRLQGHDIPALRIAALKVTEGARARIEKAGGEVFSLDQLAQLAPTGEDAVLLRGRISAREAVRHFGVPVHGDVAPFVRSKGNNFEHARGRRKSTGFKI